MPNADNYPTEEELTRIRDWPYVDDGKLTNPAEWFAFIRPLWTYADCGYWSEGDGKDELGRPVHRYMLSTGGWSGNEEIGDAMADNRMLWFLTWRSTQRGGHYVFEVPA